MKFRDPQFNQKNKDPRDLRNLIWHQPLFEGLKDDIHEPEGVLSKVLELEATTFNMIGQGV